MFQRVEISNLLALCLHQLLHLAKCYDSVTGIMAYGCICGYRSKFSYRYSIEIFLHLIYIDQFNLYRLLPVDPLYFFNCILQRIVAPIASKYSAVAHFYEILFVKNT